MPAGCLFLCQLYNSAPPPPPSSRSPPPPGAPQVVVRDGVGTKDRRLIPPPSHPQNGGRRRRPSRRTAATAATVAAIAAYPPPSPALAAADDAARPHSPTAGASLLTPFTPVDEAVDADDALPPRSRSRSPRQSLPLLHPPGCTLSLSTLNFPRSRSSAPSPSPHTSPPSSPPSPARSPTPSHPVLPARPLPHPRWPQLLPGLYSRRRPAIPTAGCCWPTRRGWCRCCLTAPTPPYAGRVLQGVLEAVVRPLTWLFALRRGHAIAVFPILADEVEVKTGARTTAHWPILFIRLNGWLRHSFALLIPLLDIDGIGQY